MFSFVTGILVALLVVTGLYAAVEHSVGRPGRLERAERAQDSLSTRSDSDVLKLAANFRSPVQVDAILELGKREDCVSESVPLLGKLAMQTKELAKFAAEASLTRLGEKATPHLKPLLDSGDRKNRIWACTAMRAIGPSCIIYVDEIKKVLKHDEDIVRKCGAYALQGMGTEAALKCMPELIGCLALDRDFNLQCMTCRVLEKMGPDALDAEEALLKLFDEGNVSARGWAAICLGAIGPTSSEVNIGKRLSERLVNAFTAIEKERVIIGLGRMGPEAMDYIETIRKVGLGHRDIVVKANAALAVWQITGKQVESVTMLRKLMFDDEQNAVIAVSAVARMGEDALPLLDDLMTLLSSSDGGLREAAVVAIGNMGVKAKKAEHQIKQLLKDKDPLVREAAQNVLNDWAAAKEKLEADKEKANK